MNLSPQLVEIPFREGLDTKTNAKLVMPGRLLTLENGSFLEGGTIRKRNGYSSLVRTILSGGSISAADALAQFDSELLLAANGVLYSWAPSTVSWASRGNVPNVTARADSIIRNTKQQSNPDGASVGGISCYVWADTRGGVRASVVDDVTGAILLGDVLLNATAVRPRAIAIQNVIVVVYQNGANILSRTLQASSPTAFGAENTLAVDGHATPANQHLDVCPSSFGSGIGTGIGGAFFAYNSSAATTTKVGYVLASGVVGQTANGFPNIVSIAAAADKSLALVNDKDGSVWVLYSNGTNASLSVRFADLTQKVAPTVIEALANVENICGAFASSGSALTIWYEVQAAASYNRFVKTAQAAFATGAVSGVAVFKRSVGLGAKPITHTSGLYAVLVHDATPTAGAVDGLQNTYFIAKSDGTLVARLQPGTAGKIQSGQIPSVISRTSSTFTIPMQYRSQFITAGNVSYSLIGITAENLTFGTTALRSAQFGGSLLFAGGFVGCYDGQGVTENGFLLYPENISVVMAAGGALEAGTRSVCFCWAWTDAQGQRHRSAPSPVQTFTATANQKATWTVPALRLTGKTAPYTEVELECYSTIIGGTNFYKTPNAAATDPTANPVYNDPTADTVTFERQIADGNAAPITSNLILYTQGGILQNDCPPASRAIAVTKTRTFLAGLEDSPRILMSKTYVRTEAVAFSNSLYIDVDPSGGKLVSIAAMDDKLVIFKERQIEVIAGEGPDDSGANGTISSPILVTTDVGLADANSICQTPVGLIFKSAKGIYLLTRGLESRYIGASVERFNGDSIVSATLVPNKNQVRLCTSAGYALVWDYFFDQWSVFTNHSAVDAIVWGGGKVFVYVKADGTVLVETEGIYLDDGVDIHMALETAWIKMAGLQGFQRIWRASILGDYFSAHTLRISVSFNYQPFVSERHTFVPKNVLVAGLFGDDALYGASSPYGGNEADLVMQARMHLKQQLCESIKFRIEDVGSSPGQAYSISGLALEVGLIPGLFKLGAGKTLS